MTACAVSRNQQNSQSVLFQQPKAAERQEADKKDSQDPGVYKREIIKASGAADDRRRLVPDSVIGHRSGPDISSSYRLPEKKQVNKKVILAGT